MDYKKIDNIVFDGVDYSDYPDFCDAFISSADYNGREMTGEEIESLDSSFVYEQLMDHIF